jgi:hypothetical protein
MAVDVKHVSVSIRRPAQAVYDFVADPLTWPRWAQGLAGTMQKIGSEWIAQSPMGNVRVRFSEPNGYGVLDHDVILESGVTFHNPLRVVARESERSEIVFTVFRQPGASDADFAADCAAVERDLNALKALVE